MAEDDGDAVRAAWLYHMEGLTQAEIAQRLRMTRLRVNRLLAEARASGLVSVTINTRLRACVQLERELVRRCGVREAIVVPTPGDAAAVARLIGKATGDYVSSLVEASPSGILGVGWGNTLNETIRHLRSGAHPRRTVTSMMGGLTYGIEINTFEIATRFASAWQAVCHYLAAPIYAGTPRSRDTILTQDVFEEAMTRIRATDIALLSAGDLSRRSLLIRYGLPRDVPVAALRAKGAVGDVLGHFIDRDGRPIAHPINRRVIGLALDELRRIPTVILASGGRNKAEVIAAAVRAKLANVLITDEAVARVVVARGAAEAP